MSSQQPRIVELTDLPRADPNVASVVPIVCGAEIYAVYKVKDFESDDGPCAVVSFEHCLGFMGHGPNDEALHNHPLYECGLRPYAIQEVIDSPWVDERARLLHKDGDPRLGDGQRHFIFALKENSFECAARSYSLLGVFPSYEAARDAVFARVIARARQT